jgi:DNA polymerase-4
MERRIAHLDMDAFYASVELLRYPQLRGQAVVVGGGRGPGPAPDAPFEAFARLRDYVGRGVATTASYEARHLGVHSALGLMKAAVLAPDAILLPANFDAYRLYSQQFKEAVRQIAPCIEDRGIDEIYIDLEGIPGDSLTLGQQLKDAVRAATGLSCSIGITPNKLLAKIASELDKPDGLTVLGHADLPARIWPLPARRINGIGPKAAARLEQMGIQTIGDLAARSVADLVQAFGSHYGEWLADAAHGRDERPVVTQSEPRSISRETTFERDLHARHDRDALTGILLALCARVAEDLERKGYVARTIGIKLRYDDFQTVTRDRTLATPAGSATAIVDGARDCLRRVPLERRLRLLGVRAAGLLPRDSFSSGPPLVAREAQSGWTLPLFCQD